MIRRLLTLIVKELQSLLRDPESRRVLIVPVILQLALFPFAMTLEVKNAPVAVLNLDGGAASVELVQRVARASAFPRVVSVHGLSEVGDAIDHQRALVVLYIPSDFSRNIAAGKAASLQAILDGRRSNSAQIALSYVQGIVDGYSKGLVRAGARPDSVGSTTVEVRNWFNPNLDYKWYIVPSLIVVIATIGFLVVTALSVAREREQGTLDQLLVSPLSHGQIMLGKALPAMLVAGVQATLVLIAAVAIYRIPIQGSVALIYLGLLCYGFALVGIGLLISSVCSTQQQAFLGVFAFVAPALLLSGFFAPIENMPVWLQHVTWLDPARHFISIVRGVYLKDIGLGLFWASLWPLLIISSVTLALGYLMFRRRLQ